MARDRNFDGSQLGTKGDILPPMFDVETVSRFFSKAPEALSEHFPDSPGRSASALERASDLAMADIETKAQPADAEWIIDRPDALEVEDPTEPTSVETESADFAYAKPAGKGKSWSSDSGDTSVKGKGRKKNTDTTDDSDTTDGGGSTDGGVTDGGGSTDGGVTDGGVTDGGGSTDGGVTDGGVTDGGGTTDGGDSGSGETNTGSNDPNVYVSGLDTPGGFNIEIGFEGNWTDAFKQVVKDAAEYLSDIITGDVASHNGIDDIQLRAIMNNIDGSGGHLGVGGTLKLRPDSFLPSEGFIRLDESDAQRLADKGTFDDTVFHEMVHSLGFGTIWDELGLVENIGGVQRFTGSNAIEAYNDIFPEIAADDPYSHLGVKVSGDEAHWDHGTFTYETMTTSIYSSGNYVSDMSIAALEDMGYETVYQSDEFVLA